MEKPSIDIEGDECSEHTTSSTSAVDGADKRNRAIQTESIQDPTQDQYPHGLKLVLLAGASVVAVFLIALDQVGND